MKAVLSDRIYLDVLPHQQQKIDKELTYSIAPYKYGDPPIIIKNMALIKNGLVAITCTSNYVTSKTRFVSIVMFTDIS